MRCSVLRCCPRHRQALIAALFSAALLPPAIAAPLLLSQGGTAGVSRWSATWADGGYWKARPWVWGWYRAQPADWRWWPDSAKAWRIDGLAGPVEITAMVDAAIDARSTVIGVPQTDLRLDFGSLQAVRPMSARFAWTRGDAPFQQAIADCQVGSLDGAPPVDAARAELLNAACQVAYGSP